jgi:hypothetical protein
MDRRLGGKRLEIYIEKETVTAPFYSTSRPTSCMVLFKQNIRNKSNKLQPVPRKWLWFLLLPIRVEIWRSITISRVGFLLSFYTLKTFGCTLFQLTFETISNPGFFAYEYSYSQQVQSILLNTFQQQIGLCNAIRKTKLLQSVACLYLIRKYGINLNHCLKILCI